MEPSDFPGVQQRGTKPRKKGITEVRASYYTVVGLNYLEDLLETVGEYIDSIKFAGGAITLYLPPVLKEFIRMCHDHQVMVSTGGYVEHMLTQGKEQVEKYLDVCRNYEFDIVELSAGFISIDPMDWLRLCEEVMKRGMKPRAEVGILFGAGGASPERNEGVKDASFAISLAKRFLEAGVYQIMIESEDNTENVKKPRSDVPAAFINALGTEQLMFEAADPEVFSRYIRDYGPDINLFVDHSQILELECLRRGIWGENEVWGRVVRL